MFDFKGISHVIRNMNGTISVVGSVPVTCLAVETPPTREQVMAGRTFEQDGATYGWKGRVFSAPEDAFSAVLAGGGSLCSCAACLRPAPIA